MIAVTAKLVSGTPYGPGRHFMADKLADESNDEREIRTWRDRCHYSADGDCFIPGIAFKRAIDTAAKTLSEKVPDKGAQTFTKHFERAVIVVNNLDLGMRKDEVHHTDVFVPSQPALGKRSPRVTKRFPRFDEWSGSLEIMVLDPIINEKVFRRTLEYAGNFVGVGVWRPENAGMWGRFVVKELLWKKGA